MLLSKPKLSTLNPKTGEIFFFFSSLDKGPKRPLSLELSDSIVYEPKYTSQALIDWRRWNHDCLIYDPHFKDHTQEDIVRYIKYPTLPYTLHPAPCTLNPKP
jgi:hypothetical protein